jgi:hypothetical protein
MIIKTSNSILLIFFTILLVNGGFIGSANAAEPSLPNWAAVFGSDGSLLDQVDADGDPGSNGIPDYKDLYGGIDAVFIDDNISDSLATDMTVRNGEAALADEVVFNGTIDAPHDIGNTHIMAKRDQWGDLELYAGVELLSSATVPADSYVDIEFNQGVVRVRSGIPWPIYGDRLAGDLLVRMNYTGGALSSVDFKSWDGSAYQVLNSVVITQTCQNALTYVICTGAPVLAYPAEGYDVWDIDGNPIPSVAPDGFAEVGIDVAGLLGASRDFASISIRTPNDIALSSFSAMDTASEGGN